MGISRCVEVAGRANLPMAMASVQIASVPMFFFYAKRVGHDWSRCGMEWSASWVLSLLALLCMQHSFPHHKKNNIIYSYVHK